MSELANEYMANRWMADKNLQDFIRQAHTDMYVGCKNGVSDEAVKEAVLLFVSKLQKQMIPQRVSVGA